MMIYNETAVFFKRNITGDDYGTQTYEWLLDPRNDGYGSYGYGYGYEDIGFEVNVQVVGIGGNTFQSATGYRYDIKDTLSTHVMFCEPIDWINEKDYKILYNGEYYTINLISKIYNSFEIHHYEIYLRKEVV